MQKFVLKFLLLFGLVISFAFFSLTAFQKYSMDMQMAEFQKETRPNVESPYAPDFEFEGPNFPNPPKDPPSGPPLVIIMLISLTFVFIILKHIEKNYIKPLNTIQKGLFEIRHGNFNIEFLTRSESEKMKETFETLNEVAEGLQQRDKLQDDFIRNLVHDLRNPIIAQERAIAMLKEEFKDHELIDGLMQNSEMYLDMINLIIEAHSIGDIKIDKIKFNLAKLADSLVKALQPAAGDKKIQIINDIPKNLNIWADYISTVRIITNLITNAIEHIPENKKIKLTAKNEQNKSIIVVEDNSGNLSEKDAERIFDKFSPKENTGRKSVSGLGLQIVQQLVVKNGGHIKLDRRQFEYTKFIIELPTERGNVK